MVIFTIVWTFFKFIWLSIILGYAGALYLSLPDVLFLDAFLHKITINFANRST